MADNTYTQPTSDDQANVYQSGQAYFGLKLGTGASGVGEKLVSCSFYINRVGSPSGNIYAYVLDSSHQKISGQTSTNSFNATTDLSTSTYNEKTFTFDGTHTLAEGEKIVYEYGDGDGSNYTRARFSSSNQIDTTALVFFKQHGGSFQEDADKDASFTLKTNNVSDGGTGSGSGGSEGDAPTGDGLPQTERLQILSTVVPR